MSALTYKQAYTFRTVAGADMRKHTHTHARVCAQDKKQQSSAKKDRSKNYAYYSEAQQHLLIRSICAMRCC